MPLEDFERWFRAESHNVHAWGDPELVDAVLAVEAVLSDYHFDGLETGRVGQELATAIRPFVLPEEQIERIVLYVFGGPSEFVPEGAAKVRELVYDSWRRNLAREQWKLRQEAEVWPKPMGHAEEVGGASPIRDDATQRLEVAALAVG